MTATAYDRAVAMLAARSYGTSELRRQLLLKGCAASEVADAIARLAAAGYLDDAAYAKLVVRSKLLNGGMSPRRLRAELHRRGVDPDTAERAIRDVVQDESIDLAAVLDQLARRKARTLAGHDDMTRRRRLYAFLARRGYDRDDILRVLEGALVHGRAAR